MSAISLSKESLTGSSIWANPLINFTTKLFLENLPIKNDEFNSAISAAFSSIGNTLSDNISRGTRLTSGLMSNTWDSLASAGVGLASSQIGKGISNIGNNSSLSRGIGQGIATGLGTIGGLAAHNLIKYGTLAGQTLDKAGKAVKLPLFGKGVGLLNPYGFAATVAGSALAAATGPSKEYEGKYGTVTLVADTVYDGLAAAANAIPGWGQLASGMLTLNKGLSNVFGSTSGMTLQDSILGSAFMPAPVKWLNMAGAHTTGGINGFSEDRLNRINNFMGNAFGNTGDRINAAIEESGKTYGTFSGSAYDAAQGNIDWVNSVWHKLLGLSDLNELLNIRSLDMASINNQRYSQNIQGGWRLRPSGKQGMKIFNNATNHNIGMRLLSGAALIDNKAMILCSAVD